MQRSRPCTIQAWPAHRRHFKRNAAAKAQFRPCIDIHQGQVKQIVGGSLRDGDGTASAAQENFVSQKPSSHYAEMYKRDELTGGHVIILGQDADSIATAEDALAAWPGGLQLGGGVNTGNARAWLDKGADKVIVTSFAFKDGQLHEQQLAALVALIGKQRLVLDLSCRRKPNGAYYVVTDRWQKFTDYKVDEQSLTSLARSCDEFLVHGVDVEGRQLGVDRDLIHLLSEHAPIPTTYAGGVHSMGDLHIVDEAGRGRINITVGSALDIFGGALPYSQVLEWHRAQEAVHA